MGRAECSSATCSFQQVLYPTLSDYDIRYYVMEILKVGACKPGK